MKHREGDWVRLVSVAELQGQPLALVGELGVVFSAYGCDPPCFDVRFVNCMIVCSAAMLEPAARVTVLIDSVRESVLVRLQNNANEPPALSLHGSTWMTLQLLMEVGRRVKWRAERVNGVTELWREE